MSRIENKQAEQAAIQQAQQARLNEAKKNQASQDAKKKFEATLSRSAEQSGREGVNKQKGEQKAKTQTQENPGKQEVLLKHQGDSVMLRRGGNTVADMQARLQSQQQAGTQSKTGVQSKADSKVDSSEGGTQGKSSVGSTGGKGEDALSIDAREGRGGGGTGTGAGSGGGFGRGGSGEKLEKDLLKDDLSAFQVGNQAMNRPMDISKPVEIQVSGSRIPEGMLDKMVENARVGVNAKGEAEMQFDLKGDVLGGLKMRMSMEHGELKAIFVASNPEVRKFMDGNLKDLERILEDRGIHIRDLEVRDPEEDRRQRQRDQSNKDREQAWEQAENS